MIENNSADLVLTLTAQRLNMMLEPGGHPSMRLMGHGKRMRVMPILSVVLTTHLVALEQRLSVNM